MILLGDGSEDEDYSASLSAVLRQRRASVRRSRKGRTRRPSSPFLADEQIRSRRRSSVFTTSSGEYDYIYLIFPMEVNRYNAIKFKINETYMGLSLLLHNI